MHGWSSGEGRVTWNFIKWLVYSDKILDEDHGDALTLKIHLRWNRFVWLIWCSRECSINQEYRMWQVIPWKWVSRHLFKKEISSNNRLAHTLSTFCALLMLLKIRDWNFQRCSMRVHIWDLRTDVATWRTTESQSEPTEKIIMRWARQITWERLRSGRSDTKLVEEIWSFRLPFSVPMTLPLSEVPGWGETRLATLVRSNEGLLRASSPSLPSQMASARFRLVISLLRLSCSPSCSLVHIHLYLIVLPSLIVFLWSLIVHKEVFCLSIHICIYISIQRSACKSVFYQW